MEYDSVPVQWKRITVRTSRRAQIVDVTEAVAKACRPDGDGLAVIYCPHTTAGVLIQEAEPGLIADLEAWLARTVPEDSPYLHNRVDNNASSHLRSVVAGASVVVPVREGRPALGTWQRILLAEFDGPRERTLEIGMVE